MISVIIPVYNVEKYITECINSLLNQTYKNIEIIVVDDGSTDNSYKILQKLSKKHQSIRLFHKANGGVSSARNYALKYVNGEYVSFIDADDYLEPEAYEILIKNIKNNDLITFNWNQIYVDKIIKCGMNQNEKMNNKKALETCIKPEDSFLGYLWNKLFKSEIIFKNNLKFNEKISICEDQLFVIDYLSYCKNIISITKPLYNYRMRKSAASKQFNLSKFITLLEAYDIIYTKWLTNNLSNKEFIEYEYLYHYYLFKKHFEKTNFKLNKRIINEYENVIKNKNINYKKREELFFIKNFIYYYKIKNKFKKKYIMYD